MSSPETFSPAATEPRRSRWRFSLRGLMLLAAVSCVVFALLAALFPRRVPQPTVKAVLLYSGASPAEVDETVAAELELACRAMDVERWRLVSSQGRCEVFVIGRLGDRGDRLADDLIRDLNRALDELPFDVELQTAKVVADHPVQEALAISQIPALQIELDRERLAHYGVTAAAVNEALPLRLSTGRVDPAHLRKLRQTPITTPDGDVIPLDAVAGIYLVNAPSHHVRSGSGTP